MSSGRLVCRSDIITSFSGVTFVLFCFIFVFMFSLKLRPFVQSSFDRLCKQRPDNSHTMTLFLFLDMSLFPSIFLYHFRFLFV